MRIGAEKQGRSSRGRTSGVSSFKANATGVTAAPLGDIIDAQDPGREALISEGRSLSNLAGRPTPMASPSAPPLEHRSVLMTDRSQRITLSQDPPRSDTRHPVTRDSRRDCEAGDNKESVCRGRGTGGKSAAEGIGPFMKKPRRRYLPFHADVYRRHGGGDKGIVAYEDALIGKQNIERCMMCGSRERE